MKGSMNSSPAIEKARKILLIILGIQIVLSIINIILSFVGNDSIGNIVIGFLRLVYLALFVYVVIQYNQAAINIFAILSIVVAILVGISLILSIITGIALYSLVSLSDIDKEVDGIIIVALVFTGIEFIISILQAVYSFRLNNLLKGQDGYIAF